MTTHYYDPTVDRWYNNNPYCTHCKTRRFTSPIEEKAKLCYVCIHERDKILRYWKAQRGTESGVFE